MLTLPQGYDFSSLFSDLDFAARQCVIVAISGGSDSTALLFLLNDFLARNAFKTRPLAVTVDHGLRESSAQEARDVHRLCESIGVRHLTLRWTGQKPATGLSAAARMARHKLLAAAARENRTDLVLLGHTADDQAETVLMRTERNDEDRLARGLAGIAPATLFDGGIWFARPLLTTRRNDLRLYLSRSGRGWIDDPSNTDSRYERARMRMALAGEQDSTCAALEHASVAARHREKLGRQAAALIASHVDRPAAGLLRLSSAFAQGEEPGPAVYALRILLAVAGGTAHLPDERRTLALYNRIREGRAFRSVLSRTLVDCRRVGTFLLRELRDLPPLLPRNELWDGRYHIKTGPACERSGEISLPDAIPESLQKLAAASQPLLPQDLHALPVLAPWAAYLPSFDIIPAQASALLVRAREIPSLPFRRQN